MNNIHKICHPLIEHKLSILRDIKTDPFQFRMLIDEITHLMVFEACRDLNLKDIEVTTPITKTKAKKLDEKIMICPILRAAIGMLDGVYKLIPDASVGFLGFQRNEETLEAEFYFAKLSQDANTRTAIVIDPMFATGSTAITAVEYLQKIGVKKIKFISIISAPQAVSYTHLTLPTICSV